MVWNSTLISFPRSPRSSAVTCSREAISTVLPWYHLAMHWSMLAGVLASRASACTFAQSVSGSWHGPLGAAVGILDGLDNFHPVWGVPPSKHRFTATCGVMPVCTVPHAVTVDWMSSDTTNKSISRSAKRSVGSPAVKTPQLLPLSTPVLESSAGLLFQSAPDVGPIEGVEPRGNPGGKGEVAWGPALP